jgi:hypothetical protein
MGSSCQKVGKQNVDHFEKCPQQDRVFLDDDFRKDRK